MPGQVQQPGNPSAVRIVGWILTVLGAIVAGLVIWVAATAYANGVPIINTVRYSVVTTIFLLPLVIGVVMLLVSRRKA